MKTTDTPVMDKFDTETCPLTIEERQRLLELFIGT